MGVDGPRSVEGGGGSQKHRGGAVQDDGAQSGTPRSKPQALERTHERRLDGRDGKDEMKQ
jgi:hypothetical protein